MQRCVQRCTCVPSYPHPLQAPESPRYCRGGFRAPPGAGAGALSHCSTAPLPGEGSTAPGKGELILGPHPAGISATPPPLGHYLGSLQCPCTHRIAQLYPTPRPCITFGGDPGILPWPRRCDMGQSPLSMLLPTAASVPSPSPCPAAESPVGLDKTRCPTPTWRVAQGDGDGRGAVCPGGDGRGGRAAHCPSSVRGHARLPRCSPPVGMGRPMGASALPQCGPPQPIPQHPPALEVSQETLRTGSSSPG